MNNLDNFSDKSQQSSNPLKFTMESHGHSYDGDHHFNESLIIHVVATRGLLINTHNLFLRKIPKVPTQSSALNNNKKDCPD